MVVLWVNRVVSSMIPYRSHYRTVQYRHRVQYGTTIWICVGRGVAPSPACQPPACKACWLLRHTEIALSPFETHSMRRWWECRLHHTPCGTVTALRAMVAW